MVKSPVIGVLGLQGDFEAHLKMLEERLGVSARIVRTSAEIAETDALILPGGESTTVGKLMARHGIDDAINRRAKQGMPIYGTCAGLILLASDIEGSDQHRLGLMDVTVARNAFGRQIDSFEADIPVPAVGKKPVHGVFIRAPYVSRHGKDVEELGRFEDKVVAVRQANILGTAFHPELTDDPRMHEMFVRMIRKE